MTGHPWDIAPQAGIGINVDTPSVCSSFPPVQHWLHFPRGTLSVPSTKPRPDPIRRFFWRLFFGVRFTVAPVPDGAQ